MFSCLLPACTSMRKLISAVGRHVTVIGNAQISLMIYVLAFIPLSAQIKNHLTTLYHSILECHKILFLTEDGLAP